MCLGISIPDSKKTEGGGGECCRRYDDDDGNTGCTVLFVCSVRRTTTLEKGSLGWQGQRGGGRLR